MTWAAPTTDLRTLLSDGATDRYRFRKRVFGEINGTNLSFKTFEFRRITNFTTAAAPLGVYKNGVRLAVIAISADFPNTGEFTLVAAPVDGDLIEASYYSQWFTDAELENFNRLGTNWLGYGDTPGQLAQGLIPACINYAASEAYLKLAIRWRENASETYRVEDSPSPTASNQTDEFTKLAEAFKDRAKSLRDDYYTRQGQSLSPIFRSIQGNVRKMP